MQAKCPFSSTHNNDHKQNCEDSLPDDITPMKQLIFLVHEII